MTNSRDQLRQRLKLARKNLGPSLRGELSHLICRRICRLPSFLKANRIALYLAMTHEVEVAPLITTAWSFNKDVYVPIVVGQVMEFAELTPHSKLGKNQFGIAEPEAPRVLANPAQLDLVIAPLLGFDEHCNRLGMGGGYYDRAFAFLTRRNHWFKPKLVAAAFECQKTAMLSPQSWDVPMWCVATETNTYQRSGVQT